MNSVGVPTDLSNFLTWYIEARPHLWQTLLDGYIDRCDTSSETYLQGICIGCVVPVRKFPMVVYIGTHKGDCPHR